MASTFTQLVTWRSVFLFVGTGSLVKGIGLGLGASESLIADCRHGIRADQLPVAGYGYTTKKKARVVEER